MGAIQKFSVEISISLQDFVKILLSQFVVLQLYCKVWCCGPRYIFHC